MDYKTVFTDLCLELQQNRSWIKGLGKNPFTHSLTAVPFVRGHQSVFPRTPRNTGVYTRHPTFVTATVYSVQCIPKFRLHVKPLDWKETAWSCSVHARCLLNACSISAWCTLDLAMGSLIVVFMLQVLTIILPCRKFLIYFMFLDLLKIKYHSIDTKL